MLLSPDSRFAVALAAVTLVGPLAVHLFLPLMPAIKQDFAVSDALAEGAFAVTLAMIAVATLAYGTLSDRYGRRRVLLSGLACFVVGSALSALAHSMTALLVGRLVQALGAGCGLTLTRAIARDVYGADRLVKAIAYLTMAYTVGPMIAPPLGGFLLDTLGWRSAFWFACGAGALITLAAYAVLHETRSVAERDQMSPGLLRDYWTLLSQPRFTAFVMQSAFCSGSFFSIAAASPFLMTERLGRSATEYGLYFFAFPAGYCIGNWISSRLSGRVSIEAMVLAGSALSLAATVVQAGIVIAGVLTPLVIFVPGFFVTFAQGLALPNAQAGAMQVVPRLAGTAAGIGAATQMLAAAVFAQIYGLIADGTAYPMIIGATGGAIICTLAGAIPYLMLRSLSPSRG